MSLEYESLFPDEPNMYLMQIDAYFVRKNYHKTLEAINKLDAMIDKDPVLDFWRAACYSYLNEAGKRTECLERLIKNMPYFEDGLFELIDDYLSRGESEKAGPFITRFRAKSEFNQDGLSQLLNQYNSF